jgi:hypothetical protein
VAISAPTSAATASHRPRAYRTAQEAGCCFCRSKRQQPWSAFGHRSDIVEPYDPECMSDDIASEVVAKYAVMGPRVELERTLPLEPGETPIVGVIAHTTYRDSRFDRHRRGFLRLTTQRLCIVRHYGFIRDRIIVLPPRAITGVERQGPVESVHIRFRLEGGDRVIIIVTWREPTVPIDRNVLESHDLDEKLRHVAAALGSAASNRG